MAKANVCRYCSSYRPCEKLKGYLGICDVQKRAKGYDDNCEGFSEGPQMWLLCGAPVQERKRHAANN